MSIRWKLISMYLFMLVIFLIFVNITISGIVREIYIEERRATFDEGLETISSDLSQYLGLEQIKESQTEQINNKLSKYGYDIASDVLVLNKDKEAVGSSNDTLSLGTQDDYIVRRALLGKSEYEISTLDGEVMRIAYPIKSDEKIVGVLYMVNSIADIYKTINYLNKSLAILSFVGIIIMTAVKFAFTGYVFKPLENFSEAICKISDGDLNQKIDIDTNDEFKNLADTFNSMTYKLREADSQRKDFIGYVSHELKTPLSTIKLLSETLAHDENMDMEICREFLMDISSESDRLTDIVNDLLTLTELEISEIKIDFEMANLTAIAEKIYLNMKPLASEKEIDFKFTADGDLEFKFDPDRIKQTLINIVSNAIKYTEGGGCVELKLYRDKENIISEVSDNGIGIPEKNLPYIFDRFYRVDKARSRATGGSGLGLSIAKQIVSLHGGNIEVESRVGGGSTFRIALPYKT